MATLIIEVENKKLKFFRELIQNLSFVKVQEAEIEEDTDEEVFENIREGVKELNLVLQGKKKSRPAREFLNEL